MIFTKCFVVTSKETTVLIGFNPNPNFNTNLSTTKLSTHIWQIGWRILVGERRMWKPNLFFHSLKVPFNHAAYANSENLRVPFTGFVWKQILKLTSTTNNAAIQTQRRCCTNQVGFDRPKERR
jgi:hypothetical protein